MIWTYGLLVGVLVAFLDWIGSSLRSRFHVFVSVTQYSQPSLEPPLLGNIRERGLDTGNSSMEPAFLQVNLLAVKEVYD